MATRQMATKAMVSRGIPALCCRLLLVAASELAGWQLEAKEVLEGVRFASFAFGT